MGHEEEVQYEVLQVKKKSRMKCDRWEQETGVIRTV